MKKIFFTTITILFILLLSIIFVLSTIGFETEKFNKFISDNVTEKNESVSFSWLLVVFAFFVQNLEIVLRFLFVLL